MNFIKNERIRALFAAANLTEELEREIERRLLR